MAPASESSPPTIHARYTKRAEPTACIISAGTRKIPLPMMVPTTMALAWPTPSSRNSSGALVGACEVGDIGLGRSKNGTDWNYKRLAGSSRKIAKAAEQPLQLSSDRPNTLEISTPVRLRTAAAVLIICTDLAASCCAAQWDEVGVSRTRNRASPNRTGGRQCVGRRAGKRAGRKVEFPAGSGTSHAHLHSDQKGLLRALEAGRPERANPSLQQRL